MDKIKISYSEENTHVENSYLIDTKEEINFEVMNIIRERQYEKKPVTRTFDSYAREWKGHNNLFKLGLFKSHTKDVDLNENNSKLEELAWLILGGI